MPGIYDTMWKKGVCDKCGAETMVKRSRGKNLCRECHKEVKRKKQMEKMRREGL